MSDKKRNLLFRFLYHFHIYGGLFCSFYLLIVGLSALNLQHHLISDQPRDTVTYDRKVVIDSSLKTESLAESAMKQLNIIGYFPPWDFSQNGNLFAFKVYRPARHYLLGIDRVSGKTHVVEISFGFGAVINVLHTAVLIGLDDPLLKIWAYYGQLSALVAILAMGTGIYFWFKKSIRKKRDWIIAGISGVITCAVILYLWLVG